jgi:Leucine-rich repeat (LRR) protein
LINISELTYYPTDTTIQLEITDSNVSTLTQQLVSLFPKLEKMSMKKSFLEKIDLNAFGEINTANVQNLKTLIVAKNNLSVLEKGTFAGATALESLELSQNKINHIAGGAFSNLYNLQSLDLCNNLITELNDDLFEDLTSMKELKLTRNRIKIIDSKMFEKNLKLKIVNLVDNELTEIKTSHENQIINQLFLQNNSLTCIPNLKSFSGLEEVDLSQNPNLDLTCIVFPNDLEKLSLNNINLKSTDFNITYLKKLKKLELKSNNLKTMNYNSWPMERKLMSLNLNDNELTELDGDYLKEVFAERTVSIFIDHNDWNCTTLENFQSKV